MARFPVDSLSRKIGSRARAIVHYSLDSDCWEYREYTGADVGTDCQIETPEGGSWMNLTIDCQIKGTSRPKRRKRDYLSFSLDVKTISYALCDSRPYVLFLVDINSEIVYFLPIQDYFTDNAGLLEKLETNKETIDVRIPIENTVKLKEDQLIELAHCSFTYSDEYGIMKHLSDYSDKKKRRRNKKASLTSKGNAE